MAQQDRNKIIFGFWDRSSLTGNEFVSQRCKQLSIFYKNSAQPFELTLTDTDVDRLLNNAADIGCKWLLVQSFGHLILRRSFLDLLRKYIESNDFFLMGHILDYKESYYELHHQCFLVNLDKFKEFGRPAFGSPQKQAIALPASIRSPENFHDDYTPYWLKPAEGEEKITYIPSHEGWNLINASIQNNQKVHNFNHEMRTFKTYLYPTASTENFEKALKDPYSVQKLELNVCQKNFLSGMSYNWDAGKRSIFMFNTEDIQYSHRKVQPGKRLDAIFAVAAGFKPLKILLDNDFHSGTKVIYFDYCLNSLEFRKLMLRDWDGQNFVEFLKRHQDVYKFGHFQCVPRNDLSQVKGDPAFADMPVENPDWDKHEKLWQKTLDQFGGAEKFRALWKEVRNLEHEFFHCDIIQKPHDLFHYMGKFRNQEIALYWSNSFSVETTYTYLDQSLIIDGYKNWAFLLQHTENNLHLYGTTPKGIDLQHSHSELFGVLF